MGPSRPKSGRLLRAGLRFPVPLAGRGGLLRRGRALRRGARRRGGPALLAAPLAGDVRVGLAAAAARLVAAARLLVDRRPGAALGLPLGDAAALVPLGDVLGLPLLLISVFRLVAPWHGVSSRCAVPVAGPRLTVGSQT